MTAAPAFMTAREMAELGLPDMPATKSGVQKLRQRQGWHTQNQGGSALIAVNSLPDHIKTAIAARYAHINAALKPRPAEAAKPGRGRPRGTNYFTRNPRVADAVIACLAEHDYAATTVIEMLADKFTPLPDLRVLQRYIARIEVEKVTLLTALRNPDRAKSAHMLALGRMDGDAPYAHHSWELDTTKVDVMMAGGRKMILGVIDRYSRRNRFLVADSESAQSVRKLLFKAFMAWGAIPARIIIDNGSGYINATVKTICALLGIEMKICPPGSPEKKPFVERQFGTFMRQRAVVLEGFTGHNVAQAQQLRARARKVTGRAEILGTLTPDQLQDILDNWVIGKYEVSRHSGIGMSPIMKAMQSPPGARGLPPIDRLKQVLTAFVGNRQIGKKGLRWNGASYWCAELAGWIGRSVHVRRDEDELGVLLVFDGEGRFIGEAVNHERSGLSEREFAMAGRSHQRALDKLQKAERRALQRAFSPEEARLAILRRDAESAGKLVTLPVAPAPRSVEQPANGGFNRASPPLHSATILALPAPKAAGDVATRAARSEQLITAHAEGHDVDPNALALAQAFVTGTTYRAFKAHNQITGSIAQ